MVEGRPDELKKRIGADTVRLQIKGGEDPHLIRKALEALTAIPGVNDAKACEHGSMGCAEDIVVYGTAEENLLPAIVRSMDAAHIEITDLSLSRPSLDDVFIRFTGKQLRTDLQKAPPRIAFRSRRR